VTLGQFVEARARDRALQACFTGYPTGVRGEYVATLTLDVSSVPRYRDFLRN